MSLRTRLHGKSPNNSSFKIMSEEDKELCEVVIVSDQGVTLDIGTINGLYVKKANGWTSKDKNK